MSRYAYERLSALDNTFLVFESANTPMHVASVAIFEAAPLRGADGGIDIDRILACVESRLHALARYRERLAYIPFENHPVWVDDERFNLLYHVRHTSLPHPGSERQLKRLCGRIVSQQLDRGKPLWETWIVEGLEGDRVAMISKVHHCMIDGISGVDLLSSLMTTEPRSEIDEPARWIPRPTPTAAELLRDEIAARVAAPLGVLRHFASDPRGAVGNLRRGIAAVAEVLESVHFASDTPINRAIGPHRRFDWLAMEIASLKAVRERLGGTLNDAVLAVVAGAVRRFLAQRSVDVGPIDFRVFIPVNVRTAETRASAGNQVAGWTISLPLADADPARRHEAIRRITEGLKHSKQTLGTQILTEAADWTPTGILGLAARLAERALPFNLVVTNVPGPTQPLYFLGARLLDVYPVVPLFVNQGLGIALFSNCGKLFWGFNADWDLLPDLHDFVGAVSASLAELRSAAEAAEQSARAARPARRAARR